MFSVLMHHSIQWAHGSMNQVVDMMGTIIKGESTPRFSQIGSQVVLKVWGPSKKCSL